MGRSLFVLVVLAAAILAVHVSGRGDKVRPSVLRGWPWLALGGGLQLLWVRFISRQDIVPAPLHWLPSLALLPALWFVWANRGYRGLWVLSTGACLNLLVMAENGGLMPIAPYALHALGSSGGRNGTALALSKDRLLGDGAAHLAFLDDRLVFAVAGLHIACSPGDLLVVVGCMVTLGEEIRRCAYAARGGPAVADARRRFLATTMPPLRTGCLDDERGS